MEVDELSSCPFRRGGGRFRDGERHTHGCTGGQWQSWYWDPLHLGHRELVFCVADLKAPKLVVEQGSVGWVRLRLA